MYAIVTKVTHDGLEFNTGQQLSSEHQQDCCESHYLCFDNLSLKDFEGLEFALDSDTFLEKIDGYGIKLKPVKGYPISIPGYGYNNGYYSTELILVISGGNKLEKRIDISECQKIDE